MCNTPPPPLSVQHSVHHSVQHSVHHSVHHSVQHSVQHFSSSFSAPGPDGSSCLTQSNPVISCCEGETANTPPSACYPPPPPSYLFTGGNTKTKRHRHIELLSTFSSFLLYSQGGNQTHKDTEKDKDTGKHKDKEHRHIEILEQKQQWNEGFTFTVSEPGTLPLRQHLLSYFLYLSQKSSQPVVLQSRGVKNIDRRRRFYSYLYLYLYL